MMSSATSIEKGFRPDATAAPEATVAAPPEAPTRIGPAGGVGVPQGAAAADPGFRPWHFFVLSSLVVATAAVLMSRQSTPEHLILISLTIGAAGVAAAGLYRALAPLAAADVSMFREPLNERTRALLEREKRLTLRSIKELEFDHAMGKLSAKDFEDLGARLRARALTLLTQLEEGDAGYRPLIERELAARLAQPRRAGTSSGDGTVTPGVSCATCGTGNDADAVFCKRCGSRLGADGTADEG